VREPDPVNPKAQEAIGEIVRCVRTGFTGSLVIDFKDGQPLTLKLTECRRLGRETRSD
jgi:hypothetical protein